MIKFVRPILRLTQPKFWHKKNIISYLLLPLSFIYFALFLLRKIKASFNKIKLQAKAVICVGNLTVGGSGKTQMVIWLCRKLSRKYKILIISKGFGGTFESCEVVNSKSNPYFVGEEARQIFDETTNMEDVTVLVTKDIFKDIFSVRQKILTLKPEIIITDDFMQNPYFHKDIKITVIDGNRTFENRFLIPAGSFREIIQFHKTDMCIVVKNESQKTRSDIASRIKCSSYEANIVVDYDASKKIDKLKKYYAFAGIGNFERFLETLCDNGINVLKYKEFGDHHRYTKDELIELIQFSEKLNLNLITTRKDYVKISNILSEEYLYKCLVLEVEISIKSEEEILTFIENKLHNIIAVG